MVRGHPLKIRLAAVDAAERHQPYGQRSRQSLSALCFKRDASIVKVDVDRYLRVVARVRCAGIDANRAQVE